MLEQLSHIQIAFVLSMMAALATGLGALPILFLNKVSDKTTDLLMGFSAGIMLAASFVSLLQPGLEQFSTMFSTINSALASGFSVLLGGAMVHWPAPVILT